MYVCGPPLELLDHQQNKVCQEKRMETKQGGRTKPREERYNAALTRLGMKKDYEDYVWQDILDLKHHMPNVWKTVEDFL